MTSNAARVASHNFANTGRNPLAAHNQFSHDQFTHNQSQRRISMVSGAVDWLNSPPLTIQGLRGSISRFQCFHHFGEVEYDQSEQEIQQLLEEAGNGNVPQGLVTVNASGAEAASSLNDDQSPETYIGYDRADNFASPGGIVENERHVYAPASSA